MCTAELNEPKKQYESVISAVLINGKGKWFRTTIGVRQGGLLSPTLLTVFLEMIMTEALERHDGGVSIGGRNITNLRFVDDIDDLANSEHDLFKLTDSINEASKRHEIELNGKKIMTLNLDGFHKAMTLNNESVKVVNKFKYFG